MCLLFHLFAISFVHKARFFASLHFGARCSNANFNSRSMACFDNTTSLASRRNVASFSPVSLSSRMMRSSFFASSIRESKRSATSTRNAFADSKCPSCAATVDNAASLDHAMAEPTICNKTRPSEVISSSALRLRE